MGTTVRTVTRGQVVGTLLTMAAELVNAARGLVAEEQPTEATELASAAAFLIEEADDAAGAELGKALEAQERMEVRAPVWRVREGCGEIVDRLAGGKGQGRLL